MKQILRLSFLLIIFFLFTIRITDINYFNGLNFDLKSRNAILYNVNNGSIIYEKNSDELVKIASLTKMMTVIVSIENIKNIDDQVIITKEMLDTIKNKNAMVVGFKVNQVVTYRDLLYASMLVSGADATSALAFSIAGNEDNFVKMMNEKADEIGMYNTYFANASGLDTDNQYSTVRDVLTLLIYSLKNPLFKQIYTAQEYKNDKLKMVSSLKKNIEKYDINSNYIIGSKTGYTKKAGYCLASLSKNNEIYYLVVTAGADISLKYPYNIVDTNQMLETAYNYFE